MIADLHMHALLQVCLDCGVARIPLERFACTWKLVTAGQPWTDHWHPVEDGPSSCQPWTRCSCPHPWLQDSWVHFLYCSRFRRLNSQGSPVASCSPTAERLELLFLVSLAPEEAEVRIPLSLILLRRFNQWNSNNKTETTKQQETYSLTNTCMVRKGAYCLSTT